MKNVSDILQRDSILDGPAALPPKTGTQMHAENEQSIIDAGLAEISSSLNNNTRLRKIYKDHLKDKERFITPKNVDGIREPIDWEDADKKIEISDKAFMKVFKEQAQAFGVKEKGLMRLLLSFIDANIENPKLQLKFQEERKSLKPRVQQI